MQLRVTASSGSTTATFNREMDDARSLHDSSCKQCCTPRITSVCADCVQFPGGKEPNFKIVSNAVVYTVCNAACLCAILWRMKVWNYGSFTLRGCYSTAEKLALCNRTKGFNIARWTIRHFLSKLWIVYGLFGDGELTVVSSSGRVKWKDDYVWRNGKILAESGNGILQSTNLTNSPVTSKEDFVNPKQFRQNAV
jgi:hypothetical protein